MTQPHMDKTPMYPGGLSKIFGLLLLCFLRLGCGSQDIPQLASPEHPRSEINGISCQNLHAEITQIIEGLPSTSGNWGVHALRARAGTWEPFVSINNHKLFIPASNTKLFTTAAALLELGEDYQFRTTVFFDEKSRTLTVVGNGDPTFRSDQIPLIAEALGSEESIQSLVVTSDPNLPTETISPWANNDTAYWWGAPVDLINVDDNLANLKIAPSTPGKPPYLKWLSPNMSSQWHLSNQVVTSNSDHEYNKFVKFGESEILISGEFYRGRAPEITYIPLRSPALFFAEALRDKLVAAGIAVNQVKLTQYVKQVELGNLVIEILSPTVRELVRLINIPSQNMYAESLAYKLKSSYDSKKNFQLQEQLAHPVQIVLQRTLDMDPTAYDLSDGSGLSRYNVIAPQTTTELLSKMSGTSEFQAFKDSLPVGGRSGTLSSRFRSTALEGKVFAKTGTLTGVSALSGYAGLDNPVIFSVMVNQDLNGARLQRKTIDQVVQRIYGARHCEP